MKILLYISIFVVLSHISCTRTAQSTSSENYMDIAQERFGKDAFDCSENQDLTFVLCKHQISEPGSAIQSWEFFVYEKNSGKISLSETVNKGKVKWFSNNEIEVAKVPGTMAEGQSMDDYAWIIDVKSGTKTKKSEYKSPQDY